MRLSKYPRNERASETQRFLKPQTTDKARNLSHIPNVVCRLYDPEREVVYREFGIDTICPTVLSTREIDRLLGHEREAAVR